MTQLLLFNVTNGLIIGAFYVLMALGLSLILNLSNVINFAHGGFLVIGGYIAYTITPYVGFWGALLLAPPLTAVIGLAVERVLIRPLYGRDPLYSLLLTFGLAFIIEDGTRFIWRAQGKPVTIPTFLAQPLSNDCCCAIRAWAFASVPARSILRPSRHSGSMCRCRARSISASAFIWQV
jgi:branched-chain amino acid transport system permease protein